MFLPLSLTSFSNGRKYYNNESISITFDNFFPLFNPLELYSFSEIPNCFSYNSKNKDFITTFSNFSLGFLDQTSYITLCGIKMNKDIKDLFTTMISRDFAFQMTVDGIPVRNKLGKISENNITYLYTNFVFHFEYRDSHIINVDIFSDFPQPISEDENIMFSYSFEWRTTTTKTSERNMKMIDKSFFYSENRRRGFVNSCLISVFFILLAYYTITRLMRQNSQKNNEENDSLSLFLNEKGYNVFNNDLYKIPQNPLLLVNFTGIGNQLLFLIIVYVIINFISIISLFESIFSYSKYLLYFFSFTIYSYNVSNSLKSWNLTASLMIFLTQLLLFLIIEGISLLNSLITKHFYFDFKYLYIYLISIPFTYLGIFLEKKNNKVSNNIHQHNFYERKIPKQPFYLSIPFIGFIEGICIYSAIGLEIHYILSSIWMVKTYITWGILSFQIFLLIIDICCLSIFIIHLLLSNQNYKWQWHSFICPIFTGLFVFIQCALFYQNKLEKTDWIQKCYFYEFSFIFSFILGIICGSIGYLSSKIFITYTFRNTKAE